MKAILLTLLACQILTSKAPVLSVQAPVSKSYKFIWQDPKVRGGCWKVDQAMVITAALEFNRVECKTLHTTGEWIKMTEIK